MTGLRGASSRPPGSQEQRGSQEKGKVGAGWMSFLPSRVPGPFPRCAKSEFPEVGRSMGISMQLPKGE